MNHTANLLRKKNQNSAARPRVPWRWLVSAAIFLFAMITASARSFFGTFPFGIAAVSAVSGLLETSSAVLGAIVGSLFSSSGYGGYLALLSALLFATRLLVSWRLRIGTADADKPDGRSGRAPAQKSRLFQMENAAPAREVRDTGQRTARAEIVDRLRNADGTLLRESIAMRMAVGALASMLMGALSAAEGGFSYYDLFGAFFSVLLSPVVVYMIYAATERRMRASRVREAGIYTMAALFTYALSALSPDGFNFGYAFAFAASLTTATGFGTTRGMTTGLLCGILMEPVYAPLFALSAGVGGLLYGVSPSLAVTSAFSCGVAWGIYVSGFAALGGLVPPLAVACAILLPLYSFGVVRLPENLFGLTENVRASERGTLAEVLRRNAARRLDDLSGSMKSISRVVYALAGKLSRPTQCELRELCEGAFERYCSRCSLHSACYGATYEKTAALIAGIAEELYVCGSASAAVVPPAFAKKCCNIGRILDEANFQASRRYAALASEDKLSVVAGDYEALGELLGESLAYDNNEMKEDSELTARLTRFLNRGEFRAGRASAYGTRHKHIFVSDLDLSGVRLGGDDIRRLFERICGFPLSQPEFEIDGPVVSMRLHSAYRLAAGSGRASLSASDARRYGSAGRGAKSATETDVAGRGIASDPCGIANDPCGIANDPREIEDGAIAPTEENTVTVEVTDGPETEPCGDAISSFEADGKFYMLISDGMGSGREAALTASIAAMFLERLLTAGASMETALKMLNRLIRAGERECFATVDLAEIDLKTGEARFVKSGAAPSFVIRDGSLYRLQSKTVPVGIIRALDAEMIKFNVEEGDTVVMLSDGVAKSFEECPWLLDMLTSDEDVLAGDAGRAAEKIVRSAAERGSADDITAGIIRIRRAG